MAEYRMSSTSVLFPLPLGPVIAVSVPSGNLTLMFLRLLWRAPRTWIVGRSIWDLGFGIWDFGWSFFAFKSPIPNPKSEILRFVGTGIAFFPFKYGPVTEPAARPSLSGVASATIWPPRRPA